MAQRIAAELDGRLVQLDGRDVDAWAEGRSTDRATRAEAYLDANPRPPTAWAGTGVAAAQRLAVLRRLAAGPAAPGELLAAMRSAGWVGASDLENRLRELRGRDGRTARSVPLPVEEVDGRYLLSAPFPDIDASSRRALAFTRAMLARLDGPLPSRAVAALDAVLPGLAGEEGTRSAAAYRAGAAVLERFDEAMAEQRPVRLRYFSLNSGREGTYDVVPVRYVPLGPVLKAICVPVDAAGSRDGDDRQLALDRLIATEPLPDHAQPAPGTLDLQTAALRMDVAHGLYEVLRARNTFGITEQTAEEIDLDVWRVTGTFPTALAWDVLEQLCAWSGSAQVHEPLWLVHAVMRRLRAGLAVMETGEAFRLVKPDPRRTFGSHRDALSDDGPDQAPPQGPLARPLPPPRR